MIEFPGYSIVNEPMLSFNAFKSTSKDSHPLNGLIDFGPYSHEMLPIDKIRLATIYPEGTYNVIQNFILETNNKHDPLERKNYLKSYIGFENIFRTKLELVPIHTSVSLKVDNKVWDNPNNCYLQICEIIGNAIRTMAQRKQNFDVLLIYIPESWKPAFENLVTGFDLHDYIKGITAMQSIPTQIIREGSAIRYKCRCSVMWRFSIALYVKAGGIPWKLSSLDTDSAFIGLSYAMRYNSTTNQNDYTTCCSQVFDSDGTGLEFIAYDVHEVQSRIGDNPFLTRSEMQKLMSKSLSLYQKRHSGRQPKRLIVHKTSHFTTDEINGAFDAIPQSVNLELLQIIQNTNWKGINYIYENGIKKVDRWPLRRGCYFQVDHQEILMWTQGSVQLNGKSFYKEGKNIPSPLAIRRFTGTGGWDGNCQAILGLTKMNWNHDALYDRLPVTLGYAKVLATTVKRMHDLVNKPYEFRYFM
jgi:hypothetical protein